MNVYEAGVVRRILADAGYLESEREDDAEVLLMMTCSVRSHAEARARGRLGAFRSLRSERPGRVVGVLGCMAQRHGETLVRDERVDLVVGPDCYRRLPELLVEAAAGRTGQVAVELGAECYSDIRPRPDNPVCAFLTVMRGCDNYCSYCVVPFVKGRQRSKPLGRVLDELAALQAAGVRDVTLLGQNVLAYCDAGHDFVRLLEAVSRAAPDLRVRFLTSHPRDLDRRVLGTMARLANVCPALHLPVQSGSDRILKLMRRGYTRDEYLAKVELARELVPGMSLSTDVIVGFPSETDAEFGETLALVQQVRFDTAYMFRYSSRPGTAAAEIGPRVAEASAGRRLARLIEVQNRITLEQSRQMVGHEFELLIEGPSPRGRAWLGRTRSNKPVVVHGAVEPGALAQCRVVNVSGWTPVAEVSAPVAANC
jgi:tRNA-2-methylthio-N6-dimethylallyladenosine synthase